jgi:hypothetical protein
MEPENHAPSSRKTHPQQWVFSFFSLIIDRRIAKVWEEMGEKKLCRREER